MTTCVVFDLDDTLYLEREFALSGFQAVDSWCELNLQLRGTGALASKLFNEGVRGNIFNRVLLELGLDCNPKLVRLLVELYRKHKPRIRLQEDALLCLNRLKGIATLAIITDGYAETQWNKIDALGIRNSVDAIVVTGEWGRGFWKPHPRAFLYIQDVFPPPRRYVYVADNPAKDFIAPRMLGWTNVRIRRETALHHGVPCPEGWVDHEVSDLSRICDMVLPAQPE